MKYFFIVLVGATVLSSLEGCRSATNQESSALAGVYVNQSLIDNLQSDPYHEMSFFCSQIIFDTSGTAYINNGAEMYNLKTKTLNHSLWLSSAFRLNGQMKDIAINIVDNQHLVLVDTAFTNLNKPTVFSKVLSVVDAEKSFDFYLNKSTFGGKYKNLNSPDAESLTIRCTNEGRIYGWEKYERYQLCYAGDCLSESATPAKMIMLEKDENFFDFFTWKMDADTLILTALEGPIPDIKGERKLSNNIERLIRLKD